MLTKISNKEIGLNQISSHSILYYILLLLSRKLYVHKNTNTQFVEQSDFNIFIYIYIYMSGRLVHYIELFALLAHMQQGL